jgi:hypothetical protein
VIIWFGVRQSRLSPVIPLSLINLVSTQNENLLVSPSAGISHDRLWLGV